MFKRLVTLKLCAFFTCVFFTFTAGRITSDKGPTKRDMIRYLVDGERYDQSMYPNFNTGNTTTVSVQLDISDLDFESDMDNEYEFTMMIRMKWDDKRLSFMKNETSYQFLSLGDDFVSKIWIPDIFFYNGRESKRRGLIQKDQLLYLYKNGTVFYSGRFNIRQHCNMTFEKYPFDIQNCSVVIQSYSLTSDELILQWQQDHAIIVNGPQNVINIANEERESTISPFYSPYGNFSTLSAKIGFNRSSLSLSIIYLAPPITLIVVSLSAFLLKDNIAARINLCAGLFIPLILHWGAVYSKLPPKNNVSCFDWWMIIHIGYEGLILVVNVFIYNITTDQEQIQKADKDTTPLITPMKDKTKQTDCTGKCGNLLTFKHGCKRRILRWPNLIAGVSLGVLYAIVCGAFLGYWADKSYVNM